MTTSSSAGGSGVQNRPSQSRCGRGSAPSGWGLLASAVVLRACLRPFFQFLLVVSGHVCGKSTSHDHTHSHSLPAVPTAAAPATYRRCVPRWQCEQQPPEAAAHGGACQPGRAAAPQLGGVSVRAGRLLRQPAACGRSGTQPAAAAWRLEAAGSSSRRVNCLHAVPDASGPRAASRSCCPVSCDGCTRELGSAGSGTQRSALAGHAAFAHLS